ncbi:borealin [Pezoporus wallicus]|uniref:borealin n=1 Tax=Pezoporus wallicus TaxID=35540 RepID=UPI00254D126D|nr:borealin [Pezoporus wallicus]XP_061305827.1 borealin [Pezoporus flaviventris]
MAPARKNPGAVARRRKLEAFLKDFDREVESRLARLEANGERLVKEAEDMYDMHILRLPVAFREMNWLEFFAKAGCKKLLELTAVADLEIPEINKLAAEVRRTPFKVTKQGGKLPQHIEAIQEEAESPLLPPTKKAKHESQCLPESEAKSINLTTGKAKASTKKVPASRSRRAPAREERTNKRSSKTNFITPATGRIVDLCAPGGSSMITPRFDPSIFKTPGLRAPAAHERVYTVSANGSPLADINDIFITVPVGGGECIRLAASDVTKNNLLHLNAEAQGFMQKLSGRLAQACSATKTHR